MTIRWKTVTMSLSLLQFLVLLLCCNSALNMPMTINTDDSSREISTNDNIGKQVLGNTDKGNSREYLNTILEAIRNVRARQTSGIKDISLSKSQKTRSSEVKNNLVESLNSKHSLIHMEKPVDKTAESPKIRARFLADARKNDKEVQDLPHEAEIPEMLGGQKLVEDHIDPVAIITAHSIDIDNKTSKPVGIRTEKSLYVLKQSVNDTHKLLDGETTSIMEKAGKQNDKAATEDFKMHKNSDYDTTDTVNSEKLLHDVTDLVQPQMRQSVDATEPIPIVINSTRVSSDTTEHTLDLKKSNPTQKIALTSTIGSNNKEIIDKKTQLTDDANEHVLEPVDKVMQDGTEGINIVKDSNDRTTELVTENELDVEAKQFVPVSSNGKLKNVANDVVIETHSGSGPKEIDVLDNITSPIVKERVANDMSIRETQIVFAPIMEKSLGDSLALYRIRPFDRRGSDDQHTDSSEEAKIVNHDLSDAIKPETDNAVLSISETTTDRKKNTPIENLSKSHDFKESGIDESTECPSNSADLDDHVEVRHLGEEVSAYIPIDDDYFINPNQYAGEDSEILGEFSLIEEVESGKTAYIHDSEINTANPAHLGENTEEGIIMKDSIFDDIESTEVDGILVNDSLREEYVNEENGGLNEKHLEEKAREDIRMKEDNDNNMDDTFEDAYLLINNITTDLESTEVDGILVNDSLQTEYVNEGNVDMDVVVYEDLLTSHESTGAVLSPLCLEVIQKWITCNSDVDIIKSNEINATLYPEIEANVTEEFMLRAAELNQNPELIMMMVYCRSKAGWETCNSMLTLCFTKDDMAYINDLDHQAYKKLEEGLRESGLKTFTFEGSCPSLMKPISKKM